MHEFIGPSYVDQKKCRVIYLAFGEPYLAMTLNSIRTLRDHNPQIPVTIVTNVTNVKQPECFSENDKWINISGRTEENRDIKTQIDNFTDSEFNLYLDADTEIRAPLDTFFGLLNNFDLGFCLVSSSMHSDKQKGQAKIFRGKIPIGELPHWNGGIFLFRKNDETRNFFSIWNQRFKEMNIPFDQPSLVEAIFESSARLISFDYRWNAPYANTANPNLGKHVRILHYATQYDRGIEQRILESARLIGKTNSPFVQKCQDFIDERKKDRARRGKRSTLRKRIKRWFFPIK